MVIIANFYHVCLGVASSSKLRVRLTPAWRLLLAVTPGSEQNKCPEI